MTLPLPLTAVYSQGRLLLLWVGLPFPLSAHSPANRALQLNQWTIQTGEPHPELIEGLTHLPPLSVLSLDPTGQIERTFREARIPLQVVSTRRDVPAQGCHNLLKLAGDLPGRSGVILSRAELRDLPADPDKAHLLAEARRIVKDGVLLLLGADPAGEDFQAWWAVVYPTLTNPAAFALGEPEAAWPASVIPLAMDVAALAAALATLPLKSEQAKIGGTMSSEDKPLAIHQHRLQILKEKEAVYGLNAPPEILIEIEDLEAKIKALQAGTKPIASPEVPVLPAQPGGAVYNINIQQASGLAIGDGASVSGGRNEPGQSSSDQAAPAGSPWNTNAIRDLLIAAFDDERLTTLCFDYFQPVYEEFSAGMTRTQKIQRLLDYCRRFEQIEELLSRIKAENPTQYHRFEPHLRR